MTIFKPLREGFVDALQLALAIVMAVVGVASAFVHQSSNSHEQRRDTSAHT